MFYNRLLPPLQNVVGGRWGKFKMQNSKFKMILPLRPSDTSPYEGEVFIRALPLF